MTQSSIALLPDRGVVEVVGHDALDFLQGLVTHDVEQAGPDRGVFAGLLTPQGKILFDFLIYSPSPQHYWLDCPKESAAALAARLNQYKLRAKVTVADKSAEMRVAVAASDAPPSPSALLALVADPRHASLPRRCLLETSQTPGAADDGLGAYHTARIRLCVPEGGRDYQYGEAFPHEVCYDLLNGVDFEKGCYVGQEVVSRMHHRGVAKTRIMGVHGAAPLPVMGTEITGGEYPVGQLGSSAGEAGIALIRIDRAEEALRHGIPLRAGDAILTLRRPPWANYEVPAAGTDA